jgi:flagellar FliL protein
MASGDRRVSIKRLILFVFMPLVLLIGAAVGVVTGGFLKGSESAEPPPPPKVDLTKLPGGYVDIPDLIINMRAPDGSPRMVIMQSAMHLEDLKARELIKQDLPKVQSALILYLRKQNPDALAQTADVEKMRQEMERLAAEAIKPHKLMQLTISRLTIR